MEPPKTSQPSAASTPSLYHMVGIAEKAISFRQAIAEGTIVVGPEVAKRIATKTMPKGDPLALAETAGILAAKKTADLIPLCHPLNLEEVDVDCTVDEAAGSVYVRCRVNTHAKTGVEMEALAGVQGALLTIYDIAKQLEKALTITGIRLLSKEGGKGGPWLNPEARQSAPAATLHPPKTKSDSLAGVSAIVVTVSDRAAQGQYDDRSGTLLAEGLTQRGARLQGKHVHSDELSPLTALLASLVGQADLVVTTGGTGLGPRDHTPEALLALGGRQVPGFGELLRASGATQTPFAWLSRSLAVAKDKTLFIALPGSPRAVQEALVSLEPLLPHALHILKGEPSGH